MIKGIDVSHHQEAIQWTNAKAAGIEFAMIKVTEGVGYTDPNFKDYASGASAAGLHIGAYHFLRAGDAQKQAGEFLTAIKPYKWDYPLACDVEHAELLQLKKANLTDMVIAFCEVIKHAGYYPMIYSNLDWCKNYLDMNRLKAYDLWFARYNEVPGYGGVSIWQHSNTGQIAGISGNVDLDLSYKDYPAIIKAGGYNGFVKPRAFTCDTSGTVEIAADGVYTAKTTGNVQLVAGTANVVRVVRCLQNGYVLWHIVPVGNAGQTVGIYPMGDSIKLFTVKIK